MRGKGPASRRLTSVAALGLTATTVLAACSSGDSGEPGAEETIELVFQQHDPPTATGGLEDVVNRWNEENPNIQVRLETTPWEDARQQYAQAVQTGAGPDVMQLGFIWVIDLGRNGLLMDLTDLAESAPPEDGLEGYDAVDQGTYEDALYHMPWTVDTYAMGYRPSALEEAGIAEFPRTWEELGEAARTLSRDTNGDGSVDQYGLCFAAGEQFSYFSSAYLWSHGQNWIDDEGQPGVTKGELENQAAWFSQLFEDGATPTSMLELNFVGDAELTDALATGRCAITYTPPAAFTLAEQQSEEPLASAPVPAGTEPGKSFLGGRSLGINPNTEHPEEAWEFIQYLNSAGAMEEYGELYWPARRSLRETVDIPESSQGFVQQLEETESFLNVIRSPLLVEELRETHSRAYGAMFSGQQTPSQTADQMLELIHGASE